MPRPEPVYRRPPEEKADWLTVTKASQLLRITPGTLKRWEDRGYITEVKRTPGGWRLYNRKALLALRKRVQGVTMTRDE